MVIDCVRALVIKSANSILVHLVSMAVAWPGMEDCNQAHQFKQKVPESVLAKIPKDWNYTLPDGRGKDTASKGKHKPLFLILGNNKIPTEVLFLCVSPFSCHILSNSSIVLHFYQPAIGCVVVASPYPLRLSNGRKASLPACPAVALNGAVALGAAGVSDPRSGRP